MKTIPTQGVCLVLALDSFGDLVLRQPLFTGLADAGFDLHVMVRGERYARLLPYLEPRATVHVLPFSYGDMPRRADVEAAVEDVQRLAPALIVTAQFDRAEAADWCRAAAMGAVHVGFEGGRVLELPGGPHMADSVGLGPPPPLDVSVACRAEMPELEKYGRLLQVLTGRAPSGTPRLLVGEPARAGARTVLEGLGLEEGAYVACCPAGVENISLKAWPPERFDAVLVQLAHSHNLPTLAIAHRNEEAMLMAATRSARGQVGTRVWMGEDSSFDTWVGLLAAARLYLGNDTGAMHLAAAADVPVVAIFGGGHWPRFVPSSSIGAAHTRRVPCFGCGFHDCFFGEARCLHDVTVDDVGASVAGALRGEPFEIRVADPPLDTAALDRAARRFVEAQGLPLHGNGSAQEIEMLAAQLEQAEADHDAHAGHLRSELDRARSDHEANIEYLRSNAFAWLVAMGTRPLAPFGFLFPAEADLVSVLIPAYQAEAFLERAVRSVWNQDVRDRRVEILVVDDGSKDTTLERARDLAARSPLPMQVLVHPDGANKGVSATRNLGLRHARGALIALLDADDVFLPHRLSRGAAHLSDHPDVPCLCSFGANKDLQGRPAIGWAGTTTAGEYRSSGSPEDFSPPYTFEQLLIGDPVVNSTLLMRRSALEKVGAYPEVMAHQAEDWFLLAKIALLGPIHLIPEILIDYTMHPDSYTTRYFAEGLAHGVRVEFVYHLTHWMVQQPEYRDRGVDVFRKHYPALLASRGDAYRLIEQFHREKGGAPHDVAAFESHLAYVYRELETLRAYRDVMEPFARLLRPFPRAKRVMLGAIRATTNAFKRRPAS